jgi:ankyrin repeat protein
MKILLEARANPNARNQGKTALMKASYYGYEDGVKMLIQYHADVNLADNKGRSALMHATAGKYVDAIPPLLAAGADLCARDFEGKTVLDIARASKNRVAGELLSGAVRTRQ